MPAPDVLEYARGFVIGGSLARVLESNRPILRHGIASQHVSTQQKSNRRSFRSVPRRGFKPRELARMPSVIPRRSRRIIWTRRSLENLSKTPRWLRCRPNGRPLRRLVLGRFRPAVRPKARPARAPRGHRHPRLRPRAPVAHPRCSRSQGRPPLRQRRLCRVRRRRRLNRVSPRQFCPRPMAQQLSSRDRVNQPTICLTCRPLSRLPCSETCPR